MGCSSPCTTYDTEYGIPTTGGCETDGYDDTGTPDPPPSCGFLRTFDYCSCQCEWGGF